MQKYKIIKNYAQTVNIFYRYGMVLGTIEALKTGKTAVGCVFCLRQTRKARRYTWESQTLHVGKPDASRGKVGRLTLSVASGHVLCVHSGDLAPVAMLFPEFLQVAAE